MGSLTTSNSGSVANFQSQTYAPIRSLRARFAPVQFDKIDISINNPKSIYHAAPQFVYVSDDLPITYNPAKTTTSNGLTWTLDGNGWCSFSGTPTAFSGIDIGKYYIRSGTEMVKLRLIGDCNLRIIASNTTSIYDASDKFLGSISNDSALHNGINIAEIIETYPTAVYLKISIKRYYNNVFIQGKVFVTLDIDDKPTYTTIPMTDNLFDINSSTYYRWISDAGYNGSDNSGLIGNTISVNPNESYTIGYFGTKPYSFSIIELDKDWKFIKRNHKYLTDSNTTPLTVTTTDATHYIFPQISCSPTSLTPQIARNWKIKLVKGDTLTSYGDAYYGGYIDLISGNVVVDWRETTVGECAVTKTSDALDAWTNFYISPWPRCVINQSTKELHCACDQIITTPQEGWLLTQSQEKTIIWSSAYDGTFRFKSQEYASLTAEELKQLFYDATIIYRVKDPIATYQLTPQQLNTLIGKNYMWTNTGNIEVEYDLTEMCNVQMARHRMLMSAPHTEVANAQTAKFTTDMAAKIKDCKVTFTPTQYGSNSSLTNVRGIYGLGGITVRNATGKNIGHVIGYSAWNTNSPIASEFSATNNYGTTLSTTTFTLPDTPLVITQSQWPNTTQAHSYQNGYFAVAFDNLTFYKRYNVSFKVTDITNNPLNAQISQILLIVPSGSSYSNPTVSGNKLIFKNVLYTPYSNQNGSTGSNLTRNNFEIRNCGISFTLSEFMVTPVEDDDHSDWEAYQGCDSMTVMLPTSKNLFDTTDISELTRMDRVGRTFTNNDVDTRVQIYVNAYGWSALLGTVATSLTPQIGRNSFTFDVPNDCRRLYIKNNGSKKDFGVSFRWNYPPGTYTVSFDLVSDDPTTVGGFIIKDIQIEAGSTATAYEPYSPTYGGTLDLTTGQLTVTHVGFKKKLSEAYLKTEFDNCVAYRFHEDFDGGQVITNNTQISNIAPYQYEGNAGKVPHFYATYGSSANINIIIVYVPVGTDENTEFQAVLPLSEPLTYQLTPETIRTVKGMNNIWGDTNGNTEVTYWTH